MSGGRAPRIGVAICTLNEALALPRLLSRLLQVADADDRAAMVVVADGGSTDGTQDCAKEGGATVLPAPRGRGNQLVLAAEHLLGTDVDVLLFLHADCVPRHGALAALRAAYGGGDGVQATAMRQVIEAEGRTFRWIERAANGRARRGMVYGDSGLAVARELYGAVGGFKALPLFEDVDLSKRLRARSKIHLVESATLAISPRRWQEEGVLRCSIRNWMLRGLFELGVSPATLVRLYRPFSPKVRSSA